MDIASIQSSLPAAIITAVSGDPNGLTDASQIYLASESRAPSNDEEVWIREPEGQPSSVGGNGFTGAVLRYSLEVHMQSVDGAADFVSWRQSMIDAFHGQANPAETDVLSCEVEEVGVDHPESGPGAQLTLLLTWLGIE